MSDLAEFAAKLEALTKDRELSPEAARLAGNVRIAIQQWPKKSPKDKAIEHDRTAEHA